MMRSFFTIRPDLSMIGARLGILLLLAILLIWGYTVVRLRQHTMERVGMRTSIRIYITEGLLGCLLLFAIYFGLFMTMNEWQGYVWNEWRWELDSNIYYLIAPEILIFILLNISFFIITAKLKKSWQKQSSLV